MRPCRARMLDAVNAVMYGLWIVWRRPGARSRRPPCPGSVCCTGAPVPPLLRASNTCSASAVVCVSS